MSFTSSCDVYVVDPQRSIAEQRYSYEGFFEEMTGCYSVYQIPQHRTRYPAWLVSLNVPEHSIIQSFCETSKDHIGGRSGIMVYHVRSDQLTTNASRLIFIVNQRLGCVYAITPIPDEHGGRSHCISIVSPILRNRAASGIHFTRCYCRCRRER